MEDPVVARRERRAGLATAAADVVAIGLLVIVLIVLAFQDGGRHPVHVTTAAIVALLAVPIAARQLVRLPSWLGLLVIGWVLGLLISFAAAADRTDFVHSMLVLSLVPVLGLVLLYVWDRPRAPLIVGVILAISFAVYWGRGLLDWLGVITTASESLGPPPAWRDQAWMALSWHNQSGMLMGALAILFAAIALLSERRLVAVAAGTASAACLAATWFSASRGAILAAGIGLGVMTLICLRVATPRTIAPRLVGLIVATLVVSAALLAAQPQARAGSIAGPVAEREDITSPTHVTARVHHWSAAWGMFLDRPVTGQGPGTYLEIAPEYTSPDSNLTAHAHNVYLEALAEGGLLHGLPVVAVTLAAASLVVLALRRSGRDWLRRTLQPKNRKRGVSDLRTQLAVGSAGALAALGLRAAIDFDWAYLVLAALFAVCAVVLYAEMYGPFQSATRSRSGVAIAGGFVFAVALAVGTVGAYYESLAEPPAPDVDPFVLADSPVPWDSRAARSNAESLIDDAEYEAARRAIDRSLPWNPDNGALRVYRTAVDRLAGQASTQQLLSDLRRAPFRFQTHNLVISTLLDVGEHELALGLINEALGSYPNYAAWGVTYSEVKTWGLLIRHDAAVAGCGEARRTALVALQSIPPDRHEKVDVDVSIAEALEDACGE